MSQAASPFSARTLLCVLAVGAATFLLLLYAIGAGWDGSDERNGGAHAAANGLNGFAGLARLLEDQGHEVSLSRSEARLEDEALLVLTPQLGADAAELSRLIEARRHIGPTLLILPKWLAMPASQTPSAEAPKGWVMLGGAIAPGWIGDIDGFGGTNAAVAERTRWEGLDLSGKLPDSTKVLSMDAPRVLPLVTDEKGDVLAGFLDDGGAYPVLDDAAGMPARDAEALGLDATRWAVVVVAEPDLLNNYGMADAVRAELAEGIVVAAKEGESLPIVFDLTVAGLASNRNLLTLAFEPPFLAATLCLILAALVIAWRAFRRFGPPVAEAPALAMGKRQLARNGGGLVERARRLHLLGPPYAALIAARIAAALGIREADPAEREAAIARALASRGLPADFPERAEALRRARRPHDLLRAASALRTFERTLTP